MRGKLSEKIPLYIDVASKEAARTPRSFVRILLDLLLCRFLLNIGPENYMLFSFRDKSYRERANYMLNPTMHRMQALVNPSELLEVAYDKVAFYNYCCQNDIDTPPVIAVIDPQEPFAGDTLVLNTLQKLVDFLSSKEGEDIVIKDVKGAHGIGLYAIRVVSGMVCHLTDKATSSIESFSSEILSNRSRYLVQHRLRSHNAFSALVKDNALTTIRIVTYIDASGNVNIPYAILKIPIGDSMTDNFGLGNLACQVDLTTGQLGNAFRWNRTDQIVEEFSFHPATREKFSAFCVPQWEHILNQTRMAAKKFMPLKTLGWDVALTNRNIYFLETNCTYEINAYQVVSKKGFRTEALALFEVDGSGKPL